MHCKKAEFWISIRIDGEAIPERDAEALEAHLAACAACSRTLREGEVRARALGAYLGAGDTQPLARAVMGRVRARDAHAGPELRLPMSLDRRAPYRRIAMAVAALLALGALVFFGLDFVSDRPGSEVAGTQEARLIFERDEHRREIVPSPDGSPLEKHVHELRQIILSPVDDEGPEGRKPFEDEQRHLMQTRLQKFVDHTYY